MKKKKYVFNNLCEIPRLNSEKYPDKISHKFRKGKDKTIKTYKEYYRDIQVISAGLTSFGVESGSTISLFCDNRYEWSVLDYAMQGLSVISVPRGTDSSAFELTFIYKHSDSNFLIVENWNLLEKILEHLDKDIYNTIEKIFI
ncbi:AMP-binding protein, partial [bacterium]|nr:AMP-binding protein [bacterium]